MSDTKRPRLLDLFCGAGGCAVGYHRAGFDVVGVDNRPQPRYPFAFHQGDALEYLRDHGREFDAIHASPPCQRYSIAANIRRHRVPHPDLIDATREMLRQVGRPFIIENVPGSPLLRPVMICGLAFGLQVKRHRLFEGSFPLAGTSCPQGHPGKWVTIFGGGAPAKPDNRRRAAARAARRAMGIDWMTRDELSQAIPPAYCEFIGRQLFTVVEASQ